MSELRWNPVLSRWVVTATHRQDRTFLPPKDHCPLCPTLPGRFPTEVPAENYEIVCFENRFPSFKRFPPEPSVKNDDLLKVEPSKGICEVVLYSPVHEGSLADRSIDEIYRLVLIWADRFRELGNRKEIKYVFIFENKGEVIGVTLPHPHGQIYAFSYIPPIPAEELSSARKYHKKHNECLFCKILKEERSDGLRSVWENGSFYIGIPFYARYPYEVHITSRRHLGSLTEMTDEEYWDLACALKVQLVKYDRLWNFSLPYMMVMHQRPTDGREYPFYHFHIEFYPPYRTPEKLKYLAGCESGAGTFINDTLPEEKAAELRDIDISDILKKGK
ncbi:MAG: galactose-1-phosphate uridylyltransferase [Chloroflexi bacterium]|nr:galactose-1-phosphate uridylyltransferase [Chloroflexota bacterium]